MRRNNMDFKFKKVLKDFEPESYVKEVDEAESSSINQEDVIDCSLGVNPFGHSDSIDTSVENNFKDFDVSSYPNFPFLELKEEIIKYWKDYCSLDEHNIRFGTGSVGVLITINRMFIEKSSKVLGVGPTFTTYASDVKLCEGIFNHVLLLPEENYKFNVDRFISQINPDYTLIYIDNPNNPTGQIIPIEEIKQVVRKARDNNVCVIIDEAYGDFMDNSNSAINIIDEFENLMVVRTFSKGFGLAGLRVGYIISSKYLSDIYAKVDVPFTLNSIGYYSAIRALNDKKFISDSRAKIKEIKEEVISAFKTINVLETNNEVPIMTIQAPNKSVNLFELFKMNGVLTESGEDFTGLGKNFIRMRVPNISSNILKIIRQIEENDTLLNPPKLILESCCQ